VNLLLASALAVLGLHVWHVPLWFTFAAVCLITWRYLVDNHAWRAPGSLLRTLLALVLIVVVYQRYQSLLGRDPGVAMLFGLTALKTLELRRLRDYLLTVFLLYFLTLAAFLYGQSLWVGAYALGVVILTTLSLVRLNQSHHEPVSRGWSLTAGLLVKSVPLLIIVYLLFPRIQGSLWGVPISSGALTGLTDRVEFGSVHELIANDNVAFRATFDANPPANRMLYWRAMVLEDTDGRAWTRRIDVGDDPVPETIRDAADPVTYTVTMEGHGRRWMVALDLPTTTPAISNERAGYVLQARHRLHNRTRYRVTSHLSYRTGALSRVQRIWNVYIAKAPSSRVRNLVDQWRARATAPEDIARLAYNYFREQGFVYTLSPPVLGDDPVDEFLFDTRQGYCEYFATTFVTLMRLAGVPSRLVVGYQGGELNPAGDYVLVRHSDAHAWAEVWLPGQGWRRVDPTAAVAPERIELGTAALLRLAQRGHAFGSLDGVEALAAVRPTWLEYRLRNAGLYWDFLNNAWNQFVLDYDVEDQRELLRRFGFSAPSWVSLVMSLILGVILVMLLLAIYMLRPQKHSEPAVAWYSRFCAKLARIGLRRAGYEGPRDFARRVMASRPDLATDVQAITHAYIDIRYRSHVRTLPAFKRRIRDFRPSRVVRT